MFIILDFRDIEQNDNLNSVLLKYEVIFLKFY